MDQPTLPPISSLLSLSSPLPPKPPTLNLSPPTPQMQKSPCFGPFHHSPLLSPIDSYASSSSRSSSPSPNSLQYSPFSDSLSLPPLQGHDPLRPSIRHSSPAPPALFNQLPPLIDRYSSSPPAISSASSPASPPLSLTTTTTPGSPSTNTTPYTEITVSPTGQPILKRRRGRPPNVREPVDEGGWTFLAPTVWVVNTPKHNPKPSVPAEAEGVMSGSMAAFTSFTMDTVLHTPRKKRGRKPKHHIEGNSCFVWKELTAARTPRLKRSRPLRRLKKAGDDTP